VPRWGSLGVVRAAVGADRIYRGIRGQSGASAAKSERRHAPLIRVRQLPSPFSAQHHRRATNRGVLLPSPLVASAWRCIEALRLSSGGTALNKNSSRSHAVLTIKVRRGGPYMQHATRKMQRGSNRLGSTQFNARNGGSNTELQRSR
jgi:hypothetical protein